MHRLPAGWSDGGGTLPWAHGVKRVESTLRLRTHPSGLVPGEAVRRTTPSFIRPTVQFIKIICQGCSNRILHCFIFYFSSDYAVIIVSGAYLTCGFVRNFKSYFFRCNRFFLFLAASGGVWDLKSPTRDQTRTPCTRSTES